MKKLILLVVLGYAAYWIFENKLSYSDASLDIQAKAISKTLPMRMSTELTLVGVEAKPGKILVYDVEFWLPSKMVPPTAADALNSDKVRGEIASGLCKDNTIAKGFRHGVTLVYSIRSKDEVPITDLSFTVADCP